MGLQPRVELALPWHLDGDLHSLRTVLRLVGIFHGLDAIP